jgi:hypothetical protein
MRMGGARDGNTRTNSVCTKKNAASAAVVFLCALTPRPLAPPLQAADNRAPPHIQQALPASKEGVGRAHAQKKPNAAKVAAAAARCFFYKCTRTALALFTQPTHETQSHFSTSSSLEAV